jgi:hypothetical protein
MHVDLVAIYQSNDPDENTVFRALRDGKKK